jgi:hypothetical protein
MLKVLMPVALQTQRNGNVKISNAFARSMVSNTTTSRKTAADDTPRLHTIPLSKTLAFKQNMGN